MKIKKEYIGITKVSFIRKYTKKEIDGDKFEEVEASIKTALENVLLDDDLGLEVVSTQIINVDKYSVCECDRCGRIMVDRDENPAGLGYDVDEFTIVNGGKDGGEVLCEFCLPENHRWS